MPTIGGRKASVPDPLPPSPIVVERARPQRARDAGNRELREWAGAFPIRCYNAPDAHFQTARRSALLLRIIDLAFERPVRSMTIIAEALGVTYAGAANNVNELIAQGVAEEVGGTYPKLIRFRGVLEVLRVG